MLINNGDGTFQNAVSYTTGTSGNPNSSFVTISDLNNDGKLDLVVANSNDDTVSVLLGNGNGTFQAQTTYNVGDFPTGITVIDVSGDGRADLIVSNGNSNTVSVLLSGATPGTFQSETTFAVGNSPSFVASGFVDAPGGPDLIVANTNDSNVSVLLNAINNLSTLRQTRVTVTGVNDAPSLVGGQPNLVTDEDTPLLIQNPTATLVADPDAGAALLQVQFSVAHGTLAATAGAVSSGVTVNPSHTGADGTLWFTGTLAQINAATHAGVTYSPAANFNGTDTFNTSFPTWVTVELRRGANGQRSAFDHRQLINDAPVVTASSGTTAATEQVAIAVDTGLILSDIDNATLTSATVSVTTGFQSGQDVLGFTNGSTMGNIAANYNAATGVLSLTSPARLRQWHSGKRRSGR